MRDLTNGQRQWAALVAKGVDARAAARKAGYSSPDDAAWRLGRHPRVQALVAQLRGDTGLPGATPDGGAVGVMSADEVLAGISSIARDDTHRPSRLRALEWLAGYYRLADVGAAKPDDGDGCGDMSLEVAREIRALVRAPPRPVRPPPESRAGDRVVHEIRAMLKPRR